MDDDEYKEEIEIPKAHDSLISTSADDIPIEEEKENLASFISHLNNLIFAFLHFDTSNYETDQCKQLIYEIIGMIKQIDNNEKSTNYENCYSLFTPFSLSEIIHCIYICSSYLSINYIADFSNYLSLLIARLTQNSSANFLDLLDYPVIDGLSSIFQTELPEKTFKYLIIFIRNMLDGEETFHRISDIFGIPFFDQIIGILSNFSDDCKNQISEYIIMCLYTFTKYGFTSKQQIILENEKNKNKEEEEEQLEKNFVANEGDMELSFHIFRLQLVLIENIKEKPLAIGFLAYSWTNMIENHSFDFNFAKENHIDNLVESLLSYFIKPYDEYTKTDQESLGNVLFFISHLMDTENDIEFPEVDFSFLCDIMRNGNESLFHYASLILSQQVFKSNDPDYIKEIIDFLINLFDNSTQKKLDIALFLCDIICSEPFFSDLIFRPEIMRIIFDTMLIDHSDKTRTVLYAEAIYKICLLAEQIDQTDNILTFLCDPENQEKIDEFEETYSDEKPGEIMRLVIQYVNEKQQE